MGPLGDRSSRLIIELPPGAHDGLASSIFPHETHRRARPSLENAANRCGGHAGLHILGIALASRCPFIFRGRIFSETDVHPLVFMHIKNISPTCAGSKAFGSEASVRTAKLSSNPSNLPQSTTKGRVDGCRIGSSVAANVAKRRANTWVNTKATSTIISARTRHAAPSAGPSILRSAT